jgi:mono/diheme cytochrome c family protein
MNPLPFLRPATTLAMAASCALLSLPASAADDPVKRGEYLVNTSGCHDCHTPWIMGKEGPEPDKTRALSGHPADMKMPPPPKLPDGPWIVVAAGTNTAWSGPWGVSFTANLTPDKDTGLGEWTERNFFDAIRTGRHMGKGRPILPPMPIPAYKNYTDADLSAIFAYLRTIKPIKNEVPDPVPPAGAAPPAGAKPAASK